MPTGGFERVQHIPRHLESVFKVTKQANNKNKNKQWQQQAMRFGRYNSYLISNYVKSNWIKHCYLKTEIWGECQDGREGGLTASSLPQIHQKLHLQTH